MREDFKDVYKKFDDKYGLHSQMQQCIEEMSELIKSYVNMSVTLVQIKKVLQLMLSKKKLQMFLIWLNN